MEESWAFRCILIKLHKSRMSQWKEEYAFLIKKTGKPSEEEGRRAKCRVANEDVL